MLVVAVSSSAVHAVTKDVAPSITLLAGLGVEGDAHAGETVQHRSRVASNPAQPNLRQVHLVHEELFEELAAKGFALTPGLIGENVLTRAIDLLGLPRGTVLALGPEAKVEVTGLRNPCDQLDGIAPGLMKAVLDRDAEGRLIRKAGVMAIVLAGGVVAAGDAIAIQLPAEPHKRLEPV